MSGEERVISKGMGRGNAGSGWIDERERSEGPKGVGRGDGRTESKEK